MLPDPFEAASYTKQSFIYGDYDFTLTGLGSASWISNEYPTGIGGLERQGIGAFYFFESYPIINIAERVYAPPCEEPEIAERDFWSYLTTFWDFLTDNDRSMFENFWQGINVVGNALIKKAQRFYELLDPENSRTCVLDDYYEIVVGPIQSKPINLDPTKKTPNYIIKPISVKIIEPTYDSDLTPIYNDQIQLSALDYAKIRNIGIGQYVIITPDNKDYSEKFFKVNNLLSSEEANDTKDYAEITDSQNEDGDDDTIGVLALEGLLPPSDGSYEDISQYDVEVVDNGASASAVVWGATSLTIGVNTTNVDPIASVIAATPSGTPWATITNKSGQTKINVAIFDGNSIQFRDLTNFKKAELSDGRYYQPEGKVWKFYDESETSSSLVGDSDYGEYIDHPSKFNYILETDGDLSYLENESFIIRLTTGLVYDVDTYVMDLPWLQSFINTESSPEFYKDSEFTFSNNLVEFNRNFFDDGIILPGQSLYHPKTPIIEHMLFETYGTVVNNSDWNNYNYDNYSGKAAINSLMLSLQESSNAEDYNRALNVYYGMPIVPDDGKVDGLYESYGYTVTAISTNTITVELKSGEDLHPFIQPQGYMFAEGKSDVSILDVIDRTAGTILLEDASSLEVGDKLYTKLRNRFLIKNVVEENLSGSDAAGYVDVYCQEGSLAIKHIIDVISNTSDFKTYPEMIIYGTSNMVNNYDGIYHITNAEIPEASVPSVVRLTIYKAEENEEILYNDYISTSTYDLDSGFVHIPWPTHKFLHILMKESKYFKAYLDAPIDTILDDEDEVVKYQTIARNVSALTKAKFPDWYQFDFFRKFHGLNYQSDILELTKTIPGAVFGQYFPNRYEVL